ncbi:MAG: hypothetical protein BSOLF_2046 [Candidatus Carbobacillus altaicus]|uniref:Anti-sigma-28 factor FlgM C-terminal domain-containing protein n=1 Tax=Candidatus Carbonibacillus altaicus TaxID=2163959 RepID=A0A2R6Y3B0_9BACL|nr:MAG: hypothetical protein BSOLF_2046 [Candidatus Carbobacillus altaicus]
MNIKPTDAHIQAYQSEPKEALKRPVVQQKPAVQQKPLEESRARPDRLELSQEAAKLYQGGETSEGDKLLVLKRAIESGTYKVDPLRIADALLARLSGQEKTHA